MKTRKLLGIFEGRERERIEQVASEMGVTPEKAAYSMCFSELDKNPDLIGTDSPSEDQISAEIYTFNRVRH